MFKKVFLSISLVLIFVLIGSCGVKLQQVDPLVLKVAQFGKINRPIGITVSPNTPGLDNITVEISKEDYSEAYVLNKYPYTIEWKPTEPGIYTVRVSAFNLSNGSTIVKETKVTVFDEGLDIVDIRAIPSKIYTGDEVLLQIKVESKNPLIDLEIRDSKNRILASERKESGYFYLSVPGNEVNKDLELFVRAKAGTFLEDATMVTLKVFDLDIISPMIEQIFSDTFYAPNSNIVVKLVISDNIQLKRYKVTFDDAVVEEKEVNGKRLEGEIFIGPKETGAHALNVEVEDAAGNITSKGKRIYVGGTALRFKVEVSPAELIAGRTAIISMIPEEKDVKYRKVVFFVDGKEIAKYEGENPQLFTMWEIEEGFHYVTIYAEAEDGRAGIAETSISVADFNGPKILKVLANDVELSSDKANRVLPGVVKFDLLVYDPGGVRTSTKPRILIREDEFDYYYRDLEMNIAEIKEGGREVRFTVTTTMGISYYYVTFMNIYDNSGNAATNIPKYLIYVQ